MAWGLSAAIALPLLLAAVQRARFQADRRAAREAEARLLATAGGLPERFDPAMVDSLPEPARRFFRFAIAPGARLARVARIHMGGELSLGTREAPDYRPMRARQVLAAPHGLVWQVQAGSGAMRVSGSDAMVGGHSWTRFWLLGLVPVVRAGGDVDHLRSSFGRVVAEAAFWTPAALLPQAGVQWSRVDADTAHAVVTHGGMRQELDIGLDAQGQPLWVCMPRWSNANPQHVFRWQPFGGELSDFRVVDGCTVPFRVDGGNFFRTPGYFPFYARVQEMQLS